MKEHRVQKANEVLQTFCQAEIYVRNNRLRIRSKYHDMVANVGSHSGSLNGNYGRLGLGGTAALAVGQLIRWIRDQTRVPFRSWQYWSEPKIALCNEKTLDLLRDMGYDDSKKTCCVSCGSGNTGDWWCLDGKVGPCCRFGRCRGAS